MTIILILTFWQTKQLPPPDTNVRVDDSIATDLEDWDKRFAETAAPKQVSNGSYNELRIEAQPSSCDPHDRLDNLNLAIPPTPARTAARIRLYGEGLALAMDVCDRDHCGIKR